MERALESVATVDAALQTPLLAAHLVRFNFAAPIDDVLLDTNSHWLDLCLTPRLRNARACYPDRWNPQRFEPLGDVYLVPAGQAFHARGDGGGHTALICQLHSNPARQSFEADLKWTSKRLEASLNIRSPHIRSLLLRLGEEARHPGFASDVWAELIAGQLVIELMRYYTSLTDGPVTGGLATWRLRLIDERLNELARPPSLTELADLCRLSPRQLTRAFRVSRGCSIGKYIEQSRIELAKRLLERGQCLKVISSEIGFDSPASFCYAFRRATGETPGEYRVRCRA